MSTVNVPNRKLRTQIAVAANCDERTVQRYFAGSRAQAPAIQAAVRAALKKLHLQDPHAAQAGGK